MSYEYNKYDYIRNIVLDSFVETLENAYKVKDIGDDNYRLVLECVYDVSKSLEQLAKTKKETKRKGE